MTILCTKNH